ncbi:hypothetical protein MCOR27_004285 [Pyricularia oryzae]|uniref:DUF7918 domain-containing protein n=2 Tax=Pyricularia TaxID=48558 RepID=A0ABQ8P0L9_PYRGI|nr:hypothetical protein MCOR19_000326 [Pyricularia oryzae]KAI6304804.1 hypothetical protein MCOR33_000317 [Pyricularia grisea]KAI6281258.1 hypothetical protein MCOR27_004285 [Pyricularia oryzae]KAI6287599.1 hypothetical protein MCOR26_000499 [Pyricularia oryzae]KAI6322273.1 hypothetical protein MCOR34_002239 [Pyricularia oryzae]
MPSFRGIKISLVTVTDSTSACLPEFPHPDGPSAKLDQQHAGPDDKRRARSASRSCAPKSNPRISVYVPSQPNTKFFFDYRVIKIPPSTPDAPETKYLFFKVFINGRHIVAWGIDLRKVTSGSAYRALYGPGRHYQHFSEDGKTVMTQPGIEARYFWFLSDVGSLGQNSGIKSVADDGGLIEVQVFRAKGRTGRTPVLDPYRSQDRYGVGVLSDGLVDRPEEAAYYDYHLYDPKDSPFATFDFHYRSWQNLRQLHIIPHDELQAFASTSDDKFGPSDLGSTKPVWEELEEFGGGVHKDRQETHTQHSRSSSAPRASTYKLINEDSGIFDYPHSRGSAASAVRRRNSFGARNYQLNRPPQLEPPTTASFSDRIPQPSKALRDSAAYDFLLRRPLPELPPTDLADDLDPRTSRGSIVTSRRSSVSSRAPSITPSLLPYIDGESFVSESFELGVAKGVELSQKKEKEDKLWRRWSRKTTAMALPAEWLSSRSTTLPSTGQMAFDGSKAQETGKLCKTSDVSGSDYDATSIASSTSFYEYDRKRSFDSTAAPRETEHLVLGEKGQPHIALTPMQEERRRRDVDTAGAGKVSPKAKQLLGDELDFSSNFALSSSKRRANPSIQSFGTLSVSELEWAGGSPLTPESLKRQRQPSTNFLAKLWSPRAKNRSTSSKSSPFERPSGNAEGSLKGLKKKGFGASGSSLVVGLGGHLGPSNTWI